MSPVLIIFISFTTISFQSIHGMIIGECKVPNQWKTWLNVHRPTVNGEFELVLHYQKIFAAQPFVCLKPTGLEVKTVDGREPADTGDTFRFTLNDGFLCINQIIVPKGKNCTDYKLKFCCPPK
ncbi:unnamed protein product [Rotaria magnacalcarata]|uniref:WxxW domain-containing protein n=1 Tax=Rotaria magnacalcarata TaxID=392030 RepID=A0A816YNV6_9BILA|nr:unnamed protein product [Rotaria magnacalcarata]CAF3845147.1 unnamed protein product [Rotaria magnacalcarata]